MIEPFSIENDLLTPTMKLKRNVAKERFKNEIADLYAAGMFKDPKAGAQKDQA